MTTEEANDGGGQAKQVTLKPKLDLKASEELVGELMSLRGNDVVVDASGVEHFGAHTLQTLMIAAESWRKDGRTLVVSDFSDAATEHLALMGLDHTIFEGERTEP